MRKYGLFNSHVTRIHVSALEAEVSHVLLLSAVLGQACSITSDHSQAVFPKKDDLTRVQLRVTRPC